MKRTLVVVMVVGLGVGLAWRFAAQAEARKKAEPDAEPPTVRVVHPIDAPPKVSLTLPATVMPRAQVTLFARTNGFVKSWSADLGDQVKKGQVLAKIEAPELAAQLAQARTRLAQAERNLALVLGQHTRTEALSKSGTLSQSDLDSASLRLSSAQGELATSKDEVTRLATLFGYLTVEAPFDGTITRRGVDVGALVSSERTALFDLASTGDLVVEVEVPQWAAANVVAGVTAKVETREGKAVGAEVERTAGALDPSLRILRVRLKPLEPLPTSSGAYAKVKLELPRNEVPLQLPGSVLTVRNGTPQVATVGADQAMRFVPITLIRDLGREIEVRGELTADSRVVTYPPAGLNEGDLVKAVDLKAAAEPGGAPSAGAGAKP